METTNWQFKKIERASKHQPRLYEALTGKNFIARNHKNILLDDNQEYVEFLSCSYLGLDQDSRVKAGLTQDIDKVGILFSAARSRIKYHGFDILDALLNKIFKAPTVVFSSTHLAHLGLIPLLSSGCLPGFPISKPLIFYIDKNAHSSMQINRGLMEQFGLVEILDVTQLEILKEKFQQNQSKNQIIFIDSVGSMGGEFPIVELLNLASKFSGYVYVDDAHGMSVLGKNGAGYVLDKLNFNFPDNLILVTSLAKGFGTYGGVVVLPRQSSIDFIKKNCLTYLFSGPLINPLINSSIASAKIHLSAELNSLQQQLRANLHLFDSLISRNLLVGNINSNIPIRTICVGGESDAIEFGEYLKDNKILVNTALYPTTPLGGAILRAGICANHTSAQIKLLTDSINCFTKK